MKITSIAGLVWCLMLVQVAWTKPIKNPLFRPSSQHKEAARRFRRKVGGYTGPGPMEYMRTLRESMVDENGIPTDVKGNPTSVWCLLDQEVAAEAYHPNPPNYRCMMHQTFMYSLSALIEDHDNALPLTAATFRVYLQGIARLLPKNDNEEIDIQVEITAQRTNIARNCTSYIVVATEVLTVTSDFQDGWKEWNITSNLLSCWNKSEHYNLLELAVKFTRLNCTTGAKKIPIRIVDPATIPTEQTTRRQRHWVLQPFVLLFLDDKEHREEIMASMTPEIPKDSPVIATDDMTSSAGGISKRQAGIEPTCVLHNFTVNFADLGMDHILAPYNYMARYCDGDCSKSFIRYNSATNHARLLASAKYVNWAAPSPTCVSTTLAPIGLIVFSWDSNIKEVIYPHMMAMECGCRA